ncbi:hypothetical protein [Lederbergia galactosidilytica]|uniref:Uncharacterized protein n=1 Tax=Lederbergia galactosidilytica TaxID=217031 RepID=A0A177ZI46_9BACI|nr:hypothetical protein [Lederbergia galactosidilytica]OAK67602.1 hypothetical protein ABB05_21025 [Lederbergia galactosidilytica]
MSMHIEISQLLSYGKLAGRGYRLICHGNMRNNSEIKLAPVIYFKEPSTLPNSRRSFLDTTLLLSSLLFVQTVLDLTVKSEEAAWNIRMIIDLKKWLFYIEEEGEDIYVPDEMKILIFSSFSIQFERKVLTLDALASRKHIYE